jgi:enoyl-CoA hydratase/carnithine racemase
MTDSDTDRETAADGETPTDGDTTDYTGTDRVELTRDTETGIARLTLTDPQRRNALSVELANGVIAALDSLEGTDTRCVVIEGQGPAFSAGGDVEAMVERADTDQPLDDAVRHVITNTGRCVQRVYECAFPTVAKVTGPAFGAGGNLAIACDVLLFHEDAQIGFGFRNVGLAVDSGTSYLLPRIVGENTALELVYTGELLDADRAAALGLANHVYDDEEFEERAEAMIEEIATGPSVALRTSKRLLRANDSSLQQAIRHEASAQAAVFDSDDHAEGVSAFVEKRDPEFSGQ